MTPLLMFLAITGGIVWAATAAVVVSLLVLWLVDRAGFDE